MRHNCPWKHPSPKRMTGTEDTPYRPCILGKTDLFGKELPLLWLLTVIILCNLDMQDIRKSTAESCQDTVRQFFKFYYFWKGSIRYSRPIANLDAPTFQGNIGWLYRLPAISAFSFIFVKSLACSFCLLR